MKYFRKIVDAFKNEWSDLLGRYRVVQGPDGSWGVYHAMVHHRWSYGLTHEQALYNAERLNNRS